MIIPCAKHLEPLHIGYNNRLMQILITEDGAKFYPSDLLFHKSIDIVFQSMEAKEKELFLLFEEISALNYSEKQTFYLSEKEFCKYCKNCSQFFETSDGELCRTLKRGLLTKKGNLEFKNWAVIREIMRGIQRDISENDVDKFMQYWKSRSAPNGRGVNGRVFQKGMTSVQLAGFNVRKGLEMLSTLTMYQSIVKNREVTILKVFSDRRSNNNDHWFLCLYEAMEAYCFILRKEGRLEEYMKINEWREYYGEQLAFFIPIHEFKKHLQVLQMDENQIMLVPDINFACQLIELPRSVDYTCATVLGGDGKVCYQPIQAQFRIFQMLACDVDWFSARRMYDEEYAYWRLYIIEMMKWIKNEGVYSLETTEENIEIMLKQRFFTNLKNMDLKTPLNICREKNYNDFMPMAEFKNLVDSHGRNNLYIPAVFDIDSESERIAIWKVRYIFLIHWIKMFLHDQPQLTMNMMTALTMNFDFQIINDDKEVDDQWKYSIDFLKYKSFEEKAERKRVEELEAVAQNVASTSDVKQDTPETQHEDATVIADGILETTIEVVAEQPDVSKYTDEISDLKRQLAEQSGLLEEQRNQTKRDEKLIQQLRKDLEESQKATENAKIEEKNAKEQAKKIKQDYKKTVQEQEQRMKKQDKTIEQLETNLKKIKENAKTESERTNMEAEKELGVATDKLNKKENELEKLKSTATINSKELINLKKENNQLKRQVEINSDKDEENEKLKLENRRILEDKCVRDQEVEFLKIENINLKKENYQLSLTMGMEMCHSSTSSEASPIKKKIPSTSREFTP